MICQSPVSSAGTEWTTCWKLTSSRAGEFKNIPDRIDRWRRDIEDLEASRQRLERELENLRDSRSKKFPHHVPAYDRRAE